jgi:8-oxo-dGTP pyrophosphatase MutT (NUDIX family)
MGKFPTKIQVSAGGVAFRKRDGRTEVALISVNEDNRWQLPKGLVGPDETSEAAALREVHEETGLETEMVRLIEKIEYWYVSKNRGKPVRFHKYVYFYLLRYLSGDTADHDHEVNEARWVEIRQAQAMLTYESEKKVLVEAEEMIAALDSV